MSWRTTDPSERAIAIMERAGVGCSVVTGPEEEFGESIVYMSFPVLMFHISTPPSVLPTNILFRNVGILQTHPDSAFMEPEPREHEGVIVV